MAMVTVMVLLGFHSGRGLAPKCQLELGLQRHGFVTGLSTASAAT